MTGKRGEALAEALPALLYFIWRDPSYFYLGFLASRTRNRRLGTRIGSVVSAVAGPSPSAETALFFCFVCSGVLFGKRARNHEEAGITQKERGA